MTQIETITSEEMKGLISSGAWGTITSEQDEKLQDWLRVTSSLWAGFVDGKLLCVYGIAPQSLLSNHAYFWVWVTDNVKEHEFIFVRRSRMVVKELLDQFEYLTGHCKRDAKSSQRWLRWLGAEFCEADGDLIPFEIRGR